MNRWLDCIQIWFGCSLGISDDLIIFLDESIKTKWLPQPNKKKIHGGSGDHFFLIIS